MLAYRPCFRTVRRNRRMGRIVRRREGGVMLAGYFGSGFRTKKTGEPTVKNSHPFASKSSARYTVGAIPGASWLFSDSGSASHLSFGKSGRISQPPLQPYHSVGEREALCRNSAAFGWRRTRYARSSAARGGEHCHVPVGRDLEIERRMRDFHSIRVAGGERIAALPLICRGNVTVLPLAGDRHPRVVRQHQAA